MRDRLVQFLKSENLTATRFAELMDVQPSSISHILGGRNKPSYDFIEKILSRFPQINPDWLILGNGEMFRTDSEPDRKSDNGNKTLNFTNVQPNDSSAISTEILSKKAITETAKSISINQNKENVDSDRNLDKIILIYNDDTFSILNQKK